VPETLSTGTLTEIAACEECGIGVQLFDQTALLAMVGAYVQGWEVEPILVDQEGSGLEEVSDGLTYVIRWSTHTKERCAYFRMIGDS
jgi:hypothetical protein